MTYSIGISDTITAEHPLYPSDTLYPSETLYPNSGISDITITDSTEYSISIVDSTDYLIVIEETDE